MTPNNSIKIPNRFAKDVILGNMKVSELVFSVMGKTRAENPEDPSYTFLKFLNMGSMSSRKHELGIW